MRVVDFTSKVIDVESKFGHFNFPHGENGVKEGFGYFFAIFAYFLNQNVVFGNFIAEEVADECDGVVAVFLFRKGGIDEKLIENFTVFGGVVEVRNFEKESFPFDLSCF